MTNDDWNDDSRVTEPRYMEREWTPEERDAYYSKLPGDDRLVAGLDPEGRDMIDLYCKALSQASNKRLLLHSYRIGLTRRRAKTNLQLVSMLVDFEGWVRHDDAWWMEQARMADFQFWSEVKSAVKRFARSVFNDIREIV